MFRSIKSKFIIFSTLLVTISIGFPTWFLLHQFQQNFKQRSENLANTTLRLVKDALVSEMLSGPTKNLQLLIEQLSKNDKIEHIRIVDNSGTVRYATSRASIGKAITAIDNYVVSSQKMNPASEIEAGQPFYVYQPIPNEPRCQTCHLTKNKTIAYLDIRTNLTSAERYFYTGMRHTARLVVATIIILIGGFYFIFKRTIEQPLEQLGGAMKQVEQDNFKAVLPVYRQQELQPITAQFNRMVNHLEESRQHIEDLHYQQLKRADKLVTLGELAAEMAHEINNPLGISMSRADYLLFEAKEQQALAPYRKDLEVILHQFEKISLLTNSMLKYSRRVAYKIQEVDLVKLTENCIAMLQPRIKKHNIDLRQIYKCETDCAYARVQGDAQQLEQVLINLLQNAIDSIENNGQIKVEVVCHKAGAFEIKIIDNGPGMTTETINQIFHPFFTTKDPDKGTGLGLYIVKRICDQHGAQIQCHSIPDKHTEFSILFKERPKNA